MDDIIYLVGLSTLFDIGARRFFALYSKYQNVQRVFKFTKEDLSVLRLSSEKIDQIITQRNNLNLTYEYEKVLQKGVVPLSYFSEMYPAQLKETFAPPYLLYAKGDLTLLKHKYLAIVGTRYPTFYGTKMTSVLTRDLVENGWGIISGLAKGVDARAHEMVLQCEGKTIAVLGCGLDIIYPLENFRLHRKIEEKGLVLSEVPLGTKPLPFLFPLRNRIVTGIARGTIVIEGDYKSGAMISAKIALDQNREVFALPGRVTDMMSNGPNWLIKQGAKPVFSSVDILEEFDGFVAKNHKKDQKSVKIMPELDENEQKIVKIISNGDFLSIESISDQINLSVMEIMMLLSTLELKGVVQQLPGKRFVLKD